MKKLLVVGALAAGVLAVLRKRQSDRADAALWREATANDRP